MKRDKSASYYDDHFENEIGFQLHYKKSYYYVHWTQVIVFLSKIKDPEILEIGCGTGQFAEYLKDENFTNYRGFDFSAGAIELAKKRVSMHFFQGDALDGKNFKGRYNTVVCLEVLEHIQNDLQILSFLPAETNIIFSVPNFDAPSHVRWFTSERQVKKRYFRAVNIEKIIRVGNIYICRGVISPFRPTLLQHLFASREDVGLNSFSKRIRHRFKNALKIKGTLV
jgi:2-polyprenyl-3-methyl-5-hydroxy-6-metoxy-1,4-benzoquinol methylase